MHEYICNNAYTDAEIRRAMLQDKAASRYYQLVLRPICDICVRQNCLCTLQYTQI